MKKEQIVVSVFGLGYVGLPVAIAMGRVFRTIGFDINETRIRELREGHDRTGEVESAELKAGKLFVTNALEDVKDANFHIVAVPTPVDSANQPDLTPLLKATQSVGKILKKGDIVIYESTVYPGCTEEDCLPVLEKLSGLRSGVDFQVGFSPERINPGDKEHTFSKIKKVVSAQTPEALETAAFVYGSVVTAGIHKAESIKVAESAKIIENTQRDLNIALMNELALIFDLMGVDTQAVLQAAGTKWNFLKFSPGLVGGHCIGVDPYYLTHKAERLGYIPQVILSGRRINDSMGRYIANRAVKELARSNHDIANSCVTVMGLTFKENCPDLRNSKVIDIIRELREYNITVQVHDPLADAGEAKEEYGVELTPREKLKKADAVILAVAHSEYRQMKPQDLCGLMKENPVLIDVKGIYDRQAIQDAGIRCWRL